MMIAAQKARSARLRFARENANAFMELVLRDEITGEPVVQAPMHEAWHRMADLHDRLILWSHVEAGKTMQLSVGRVLWELGRDPSLRIVVCAASSYTATKIVNLVGKYILYSEELHEVFPDLRASKPWSFSSITVERNSPSKDPSFQAIGVNSILQGARIDRLIIDDILTYENCRTPNQRRYVIEWVTASLFSRLTERAMVWMIGNAFHPDDMLHYSAKQPAWKYYRYPCVTMDGESVWPLVWSKERIEKKRIELGPLEFARQMMCQARDDTSSRFSRVDIDAAVERGVSKTLAYALSTIPDGCRTVTGVDLAISLAANADWTVLFTILVYPNGDREVLCIESGHWLGVEIMQRIIDTHERFNSIVYVENNAAQDYLVQFVRAASAVPIRPFTTTAKNMTNRQFGLESLSTEFGNGKWIIPSKGGIDPEVAKWIEEMLYYDPKGHPGDRLMASWFAREGGRVELPKVEVGRLNLLAR